MAEGCYAGKLLQQPEMNDPTLVVVRDRNDLDGQIYQGILPGVVGQASSLSA